MSGDADTEPNKGGRPPVVLDASQRELVKKYAGALSVEQLSDLLGISKPTFYEIMKRDEEVSFLYKYGRADRIAKVTDTLFKKIMEDKDSASVFFYLKTQAGWRETNRTELTGADGGPIQVSDEAKSNVRAILDEIASRLSGGTGES